MPLKLHQVQQRQTNMPLPSPPAHSYYRAAQQHGVQRVLYADEVAETQRILDIADRLNAKLSRLGAEGLRLRFARLVGMEAETIAHLTDDGFFQFNREVLTSANQ